MVDRDHHIRVIAYRLWEEAGRPEGQDAYFWHVAVAQYDTAAPAGPLSAEEPAADQEASVRAAESEAPGLKKRAPAKTKAVASEPAAEPEKPEPEPEAKAAKAKEDAPKFGKAKTSKTKDETPGTPSWIKSEPTAKPKGGKRKS